MIEPYVIQFAIVHESQRQRYPDGWIPIITSESNDRLWCWGLLRAQGYDEGLLERREWRVVANR